MSQSNKYICIHGHYYQPPRENAWLESIEKQDSAAPFHDWNERINFECYAPNARARILDEKEFIQKIVNNYTRISFNLGATLLSWLEVHDRGTYEAIIEADKLSQEKFNGHGSAIAQVHSHLILPLANARDKETQVIWGIKDFEYRFGRKPEGMWLAETAVDTDSLEVLVANGIKYTILAPRQAKAFRKLSDDNWQEVNADTVDTRRPYLCRLPSGAEIALFFYHGRLAQGVAFDGLLNNGAHFAQNIVSHFDKGNAAQLVHIATDGESYGHHHRFGEMALADCLDKIEASAYAHITNYGEYLEKFPPEYEIQIHQNSSWSCAHGVERWRSNCGCNTGGNGGWTQQWRGPLRNSLNWLRDQLIPIYEKEGGKLLKDPWAARNDYIDVLLKRNNEAVDEFIAKHAIRKPTKNNKTKLLRLMEMQRNAQLMFTSCGWFFDEISGIETNQILQYACRAIDYARQVAKVDLQDKFIKRLSKAKSNVYKGGEYSYVNTVIPSRVDLERVGMHYAVASLFEKDPKNLALFNYTSQNEIFDKREAGHYKLALGRTTVKSKITYSEKHFSFAVLYLGQQNIIGHISIDMNRESFDELHEKIIPAFKGTNLGDVIALMQTTFGTNRYTMADLFQDEKRKILEQVTAKSLQLAELAFSDIYKDNYHLMVNMKESNIPIPDAYQSAAKFVINSELNRFFEQDELNEKKLLRLVEDVKKWDIELSSKQSFKLAASERLFYEIRKIESGVVSLDHIQKLNSIFETIQSLGVELDIWKSQNSYFYMLRGYKNDKWVFASEEWKAAFLRLGELLKVQL